ncbi:MAG: hypothetical protein L6U16_10185 [Porphyromonadaceae bacterium]|nr:MAG: hypothetical protein L6U16_10185 [Porphyromonadaceae bacterium]
MNEIKPLDQVLSIEADAHNQITKVVNKFGSRGSILYRLEGIFPPPSLISEGQAKEIFVTDLMTSSY